MPPSARVSRRATRPRGRARIELEVQIVHGGVTGVTWPVAVGHVQGMPLRGVEGVLDRCLGGRLSDRVLVGAYPEQEGVASYVAAPGMSPPGVLVLGLGPAGEVTADKVARAMTAGVLQWVLDQADVLGETPREPLALGVASVLVGTNPLDGISIEDSLAALVDGVVAAELSVSSSERLRSRVRIARLEIIELYEDRAKAAVHALARLDTTATASAAVTLRPSTELAERDGGLPGQPPMDYSSGAWWRLEIGTGEPMDDVPEGYRDLQFTSLGRRARADRLVQRIESATVDGLVAAAVTTARPDPQLGNTLFELLVPNGLKATVRTGDNVQIVVDPHTAAYPWEALAADTSGAPGEQRLALRGGLLRQFCERDAREARFSVRRPTGSDVLVIANPPAGETAPDLPGALTEGRLVTDVLGRRRRDHAGYEVHALLWDDGTPDVIGLPAADGPDPWAHIINALYRFEYRILHIAAHGSYHEQNPSQSGVLIGSQRYLTAATINNMPVVPELVFLNCCYSGRVTTAGWDSPGSSGHAHHLAASVSRALLLIGVRAVIAAGWAVDDQDATAFAGTFYRRMLDHGDTFGDAVTTARRAATRTNTWAAYQCYGDPGFRLRSPAAGADT